MRLTCPNCGAQYEVPEGVIPTEGRDVQCSNCGNTWFQSHPDQPDGLAEVAPEPSHTDDHAPDPDPAPSPAATIQRAPPPEPPADRQELDNSVSSILRQEAEREASLRAEEASTLETQPDLGLENFPGDEAAVRAKQARDRMALMRGETPEKTDPGTRRSLLPDIEEINSSLRSKDEPTQSSTNALAEPVLPAKRSGFSRGFALALILIAILVAIYGNAPLIAEKLPAATPTLNAYVAAVDQARNWLNDLIGSATPG